MSTRGYIYVMTRKETMGQTIKCKKSASPLPCMFRDWEHREPFKTTPLVEVSDSIFVESEPISKPFLGIYNQADSYVDGVGAALVKHFKTYEQALNLVAGGSATLQESATRNTPTAIWPPVAATWLSTCQRPHNKPDRGEA